VTRPPAPDLARTPWQRLRPFALGALLAFVLLPVVGNVRWREAAVAIGLAAALGAASVRWPVLTQGRHPDLGAALGLAALAVLRDSAGGAHGGYGVLVILPVIAVALHGTRVQLARTLVAAALCLAGPILLIGAPRYPAGTWRSATLLLVCCVVVGVIVQALLRRERVAAARYSRLLRAIGDGVIVCDGSGRVIEVNDALSAMTGYAREELIGRRPPLPAWPAEDREELLGAHARAVAAGGGEIEARLLHRDGSELFVVISIAVSGDDEGSRVVIATVKDISDRRWLHEQVRDERDRSVAILESMNEGFGVTRDGVIVDVNPALCRLTGFTREQLIGAGQPFPFWPPEALPEIAALRDQLHAEGGLSYETTFMRADGARFPVELTTTMVHDRDGTPGGFLHAVRDISDRKRAESALVEHVHELESLARVTRAVAHADPAAARETICRMALEIADAATSNIWEADADDVLHNTCMLGAPQPGFALGTESGRLAARHALVSGRAMFVPDAHDSGLIHPRMRELVQCASAHFQPIVAEGRAIGVLVISWREPRAELSAKQAHLIELLAHEASVAIAKAATHAELERLARTDTLTGLLNRRALQDLLPRELALAARTGRPLTVAMLDLDHFKAYNDTHGHLAGDRLLREASAAWTRRLRSADLLARWGGEEFCVVLPGCEPDDAIRVLAQLRAVTPSGQTFSAGVAELGAEAEPASLVARADSALYAAKRAGRDRTVSAARLAASAALLRGAL
jgi:diguanylate cyclase